MYIYKKIMVGFMNVNHVGYVNRAECASKWVIQHRAVDG